MLAMALLALLPVAGCRRAGPRTLHLEVTEHGFTPSPVEVKAGEPLTLVVTRKTEDTCATEIVFDDPPLKRDLPLNQPVTLELTPSRPGEIVYGCAMDKMIAGRLLVK